MYVSVYLTPNCSTAEFDRKVGTLEDAVGDIDARTTELGMTKTNKRERLTLSKDLRAICATVTLHTRRKPRLRKKMTAGRQHTTFKRT